MMPIKTYKIETIVLYFVTKKNLEISFQNGPEHETTSLIFRPKVDRWVDSTQCDYGGLICGILMV